MDIRSLRCFLAVAEDLHFGKAAKRLHMSPPPLTKHIQRLEAHLGVRLFDRDKRSVKLTASGLALVSEARQLLEQLEWATRNVRGAEQGEISHLRVGYVPSALITGLADAFRTARAAGTGRDIWVEMESPQQVEALRQAEIDLGFVHTPLDQGEMKTLLLRREKLIAALPVGHHATGLNPLRLIDLKNESFVISPRQGAPGYFDLVQSACNAVGFSPNVGQVSRRLLVAVNLVAAGHGVTLVPSSFGALSIPGVVFKKIVGPIQTVELSAIWNPHRIGKMEMALGPLLDRLCALYEGPAATKKAVPSSTSIASPRSAIPIPMPDGD
jgi:DNA-binding transcriptional LysR family regulator